MLIVKTKNGITTDLDDNYLSFDSKNTAQIKAFQNWMDFKHPNWVGATNSSLSNGKNLNKGSGYGNYGTSTKKADAKYGAEFDAAFGATAQSIGTSFTPSVSTAEIANINAQINDPNISAAKKEELKKKLTALYQKGKDSGLFDIVGGFLKDKLGMGQNTGGSYGGDYSGGADYSANYPTEKKGLSTGAMIGIGVGVIAIIGLVVYVSKKK
jgi:hypothetical protein